MGGKWWSEDEKDYLWYYTTDPDVPIKVVAEYLGRSINAVRGQLYRMRQDGEAEIIERKWTAKDVDVLTKYYASRTSKELSIMLKRSRKAVTEKARQLGLRKEFDYKPHAERIKKMAKNGRNAEEIANEVGTTRRNITNFLNYHGIEYRKKEYSKYTKGSFHKNKNRGPI